MSQDYYPSNTAVNDYQTRLAAQKVADKLATQHTPDDMVAVYDLKARLPDWNMLLNMGAGQGGFDVYKTADLEAALAKLGEELQAHVWYKPDKQHFTPRQQFERIYNELSYRVL